MNMNQLLQMAKQAEEETKHEFSFEYIPPENVKEELEGWGLSEGDRTAVRVGWETNFGETGIFNYMNWSIRDYLEDEEEYEPSDFDRALMEYFYEHEGEITLLIFPREDQLNINNERTIYFGRFGEQIEEITDVVLET